MQSTTYVARNNGGSEAVHSGAFTALAGSGSSRAHTSNAKQFEEGKLLMIMPTIKNLESICGFTNTKALLENKNSINPYDIATIEPKFFMENGKMVGLMPGDEGYEDH